MAAASGPKRTSDNSVIHSPMTKCQCASLPVLADVSMGRHEAVFETLRSEVRHPDPLWWLSALGCDSCGQWWLVAADERINDVFLMRRLSDEELRSLQTWQVWPTDFLRYADVLQLGRDRGHRWMFADPDSSALVHTVVDLAREDEDMSVSRIASLLQLDFQHAGRLAELAEAQASVRIARR